MWDDTTTIDQIEEQHEDAQESELEDLSDDDGYYEYSREDVGDESPGADDWRHYNQNRAGKSSVVSGPGRH